MWSYFSLYRGPTQCYCGYVLKAFTQRCVLNLGGEKAAHVVRDSELESLYSSLVEDKAILQCFLYLPCCSFNKEKEKRPKKCRKCSAVTHSSAYNGNNHFCDSNAKHGYLNFPEDMVEYNPLDLENIKEKQDEDNDLYQALTKHPTSSETALCP
jgi:hypothetical protein